MIQPARHAPMVRVPIVQVRADPRRHTARTASLHAAYTCPALCHSFSIGPPATSLVRTHAILPDHCSNRRRLRHPSDTIPCHLPPSLIGAIMLACQPAPPPRLDARAGDVLSYSKATAGLLQTRSIFAICSIINYLTVPRSSPPVPSA